MYGNQFEEFESGYCAQRVNRPKIFSATTRISVHTFTENNLISVALGIRG